jgi:hypothetical protein
MPQGAGLQLEGGSIPKGGSHGITLVPCLLALALNYRSTLGRQLNRPHRQGRGVGATRQLERNNQPAYDSAEKQSFSRLFCSRSTQTRRVCASRRATCLGVGMDRREFIRNAFLGGIAPGLAAGDPIRSNPEVLPGPPDGVPKPTHRNQSMIKRIQSAPLKYPFTFTLVSDTDPFPNPVNDATFRALLAQMKLLRPKPLFLVNLGDFAGPGTVGQHLHYLELVRDLNIPNICALGNHDRDNPIGWEVFQDVQGPINYHFAVGNALFVVLNCQPRNGTRRDRNQPAEYVMGPTEVELAYLEDCLRQDTHAVRFVMMHQPPDFHGHLAGFNGQGFTHLENEFLHLVRSFRVNMVCCGHAILYDYYEHGGTVFVTSAGGGYDIESVLSTPPYRGRFYHFVEITVHESGALSGRVIKLGGGTQSVPGFDFAVYQRLGSG